MNSIEAVARVSEALWRYFEHVAETERPINCDELARIVLDAARGAPQ
jgi:hypothetical protein